MFDVASKKLCKKANSNIVFYPIILAGLREVNLTIYPTSLSNANEASQKDYYRSIGSFNDFTGIILTFLTSPLKA